MAERIASLFAEIKADTTAAQRGLAEADAALNRTEKGFVDLSLASELARQKSEVFALAQKDMANAVLRGEKSFDDAERELNKLNDQLKIGDQQTARAGNAWTELSSKINVAQQAFGTVQRGAEILYNTINEGAEITAAAGTFDKLSTSIGASSTLMDELKSSTGGMVSEANLVSSANDLMSLKLATTQEEVVRMSNVVGKLGLNMDQLGMTIVNQSTKRLDALGLAVEDVVPRFNELKQTMDDQEAFKLAILEAAEQKIELIGDAADTTAGKIAILEADVADTSDGVKVAVTEAFEPLVDLLVENSKATDMWRAALDRGAISQDQFTAATSKRVAVERGIAIPTTEELTEQVEAFDKQVRDAAVADQLFTNILEENAEATDDSTRSLEDHEAALEANAKRYEEMVELGKLRRDALSQEKEMTDAVEDSAIRAERSAAALAEANIELANAHKTVMDAGLAEENEALAESYKIVQAAQVASAAELGDLFVAASKATKETSLYGMAIDDLGTSFVRVGGLTDDQRNDLDRLQDAHGKAERTIRDYEIGLKGAGLSTDELNEKIQEQRDEATRLEGAMAPLVGVTGDLVRVDRVAAFNQDALNQALFESADAAGASDETMAALSGSLGFTSKEFNRAALQAAAMQQKIIDVGAEIAKGLSIPDAIKKLDEFQDKLAEDYSAIVTIDTDDAKSKIRDIAGALDRIDGRVARARVSVSRGGDAGVSTGGGGGKGGFDKGGTAASIGATGGGGEQQAIGGISAGGMTMVGELGPELVNLPTGARVTNAGQTRGMGGPNITNHFHGVAEQNMEQLAQMVSQKIGRQLRSANRGR